MVARNTIRLSILPLLLCTAAALLSGGGPLLAEEQQGGAGEVTAVEVEGNKVVSTATILTKVKTRPGDPLNQETVDEDIKRLYGTGFFTDVSAQIRPHAGGQKVRFLVRERPLVVSVVITGNRHLREAKLREEMRTREQELLDRRQLKQDLDRIRQMYRTKGFYLAQVHDDVQVNESTNKATIFLNIEEGRKIRVRRISFSGNEHFSSRRLRKAMATKQAWGWFTGGYYRPEVLQEDAERIEALYRSEGFSDVDAKAQALFEERKRWLDVQVTVVEGPQYLVGQVGFRGVTRIAVETIEGQLELLGGEPFSQERLFADVAKIQSAYFSKGYMTAVVDPQTAFNPDTRRVDVTYHVTEGTLAYVGRISIRGNVKTRDAVIRREIRLAPGDRYDGEKLRRSKERLYNLGYFEEVTLETVASEAPEVRDLVVTVKESKTGEISFGGGFSSVDSFIGFADITQRNFDLFNWPTFVGGGQELRFRVLAGDRRRNFELTFTEPWIFNRPYLFGFDLFNTTRTRGQGYSFEEKRKGGALRFGRALGDYNRTNLKYRLEEVGVSDVSTSASQALRDELGTNVISSMLLSYTRDTRDNVFNPKSGYVTHIGGELAGGALGGDKDFWKWIGSGSVHFQPFVKEQVLEFRLMGGLANDYGGSETVPIFERFFTGGADSIRGYKERRVGPKDPSTQDPVGGESIAVLNVEYTVPIVEFLKGAFFFDAGNVWERVGDFGSGGLKSGVGGGVRVKTPFGPVRLDYGWPINPDRNEKQSGRLHFSASRDF